MDRGDLQERMRLISEEQLTSMQSMIRTDTHHQPQYRFDPDGHMRLNAIGPRVPYHPYEMYVRSQYPRTLTEASAISTASPHRPMIRVNPEFQASVVNPNIQFPVSYDQRGMDLQHKQQAQPRYIPETATSGNRMGFERPRGDFIFDQHEIQRVHPYNCFIGVPRDHKSPGQQDHQMPGLIQQNHAGPPIRAIKLPNQDINRLTSPRQAMIARPEPVAEHGLAYHRPRMVSSVDGAYVTGDIGEMQRVEAAIQPVLAQKPFDQQNRIYRVGPNGNLSRNPVKRMPRNLQGQTLRVIPEASDTTINYQGKIYKHGSNGQLIKFNPNIHKNDNNVHPCESPGDRTPLTSQLSKTAAKNQSTPSHTETVPVHQNTVKEKLNPPLTSASNQFIKLVGVTKKPQELAQQKVVVGQRISVSRGKITEQTPIPASGDPSGITIYRLRGNQPQPSASVSILNEVQPKNSAEKAAYVMPTKKRLASVLDGGPGAEARGTEGITSSRAGGVTSPCSGTGGVMSEANGRAVVMSPSPLPIQIVSVESQAVGLAPGTESESMEASNPSKDNAVPVASDLDSNLKPANQSEAEANPEPIQAQQKENPAKLFRVLNIDPQKTGPQRFYERAKNFVIPKSQKSPAPVLEDMLLLYTLTRLHPKLPKYIREQFSGILGEGKRITDIREEIFAVAEAFIAKEKSASSNYRPPLSREKSNNPQRKRAGVETGRKIAAKRKPVYREEWITEEDTTREVVEIIEQESAEVEVVYPYLYNPTTNHKQPHTSQSVAPASLQYLVMEPHEDLEMVVEEEPFDYNQGQARDKNDNE